MTLNDLHGNYKVIPIDDDIDDGEYEFAIIRIPRRTQSAPPLLESLPTIVYAPEETTLLTLPLELQREILRNLLSGSHSLTSPIKYTLHPAILRVNKHLSSVGKKVLYDENDWILIENTTPFLRNQLKLLHVPLASDHHLMRFKEHRLSIRFEGELFHPPNNGCFDHMGCLIPLHNHPASRACDLFPRGYREKHSIGRGNLLLHGGDMQVFVRAISILSHCFQSGVRVLVVESKRGRRPMWGDFILLSHETPPTTMIHAQRNSYDKHDVREPFKIEQWTKKIKTLVGALKGAAGARQTSISGDVDQDFAREVRRVMSSKVVFRDAMGWNLVDLLRDWKRDLDDMVHRSNDRDCLCLASVGYAFLLEICRNGVYLYSKGRFADTNIGILSWEAAFCLLASDTSTTLSRIGFHKGDGHWGMMRSDDACSWLQLLYNRGGVDDMDPSSWINAKHYSAVLLGAAGYCDQAREKLESIVDEAQAKGVHESKLSNVWFDLTVVQMHLDEVDHSDLHSGPLDRRPDPRDPRCKQPGLTRKTFSQRADSFRDHVTNTELAIPRNEGLEGWLDTTETLTERDLVRLEIIASDVPDVLLE